MTFADYYDHTPPNDPAKTIADGPHADCCGCHRCEIERAKAAWQWPDFIEPGTWIARDRSGCWYEHRGGKPSLDEAKGVWGSGADLSPLYESGLYIDPPEIEHWRDTLMQKPRATAS